MRFASATVISAILALSSGRALAQVSNSGQNDLAHLYLHPNKINGGEGSAIQLTPPAFDEVLSQHLSIHNDDEDKNKQRTVILLSGIDGTDLNQVIPSKLRNTHTIPSPPSISSFEALMNDYGQKFYQDQHPATLATEGSEKFIGLIENAAEEVENAFQGATNWLFGTAQNAAALGKKLIDETDLADEVSSTFYQSLKDLGAYLDTIGKPAGQEEDLTQSAYQTLRFSGLSEIKEAYGENSPQYRRAIESLRNLLQAAVDKMDAIHETRPQALALVIVPDSKSDDSPLVKRSDPLLPFRSQIGRTPFLATRDLQGAVSNSERQVPFAVASDPPSEGQLSGQCFTSEDDLNKATQNCSDHGNAIESSQGGRKCFRCQCKKTDGKEWAGSACQRVDIAKPFALLAVTTIGLVLVALWSVLFLVYEGQNELPSVLAGITIPKK